jgi:hypothetical protein
MLQRVARHLALLLVLGGAAVVTASPAVAVVDRDCGDFSSQRAAQIFFLKQGGPNSDPHRLDSDGDGVACETNPAPYYYGTSLPDEPKPEPKPTKVASKVTLDLSRAKAIRGEKVKLIAAVKPQGKRTVVFQKRADRRWRAIDREATNDNGRASYAIRAPRSSTRYRAVVLKKDAGSKIYLGDASNDKDLTVQRQRARLELSRDTAAEGRDVTGKVLVSPVRRGRAVDLEIYRNGAWRVVRSSRENREGVASFTLPSLDVGEHRVRVTVNRWRGASAHRSNVERLEIRDVTAPAAPTNVVGTPSDGSVTVSWTAVGASDLSHYAVMYRTTESTSWAVAGTTDSTSMPVGSLTNDVTYVFTVVAVDHAGNVSPQSAEVSATPVAPPVQ